MFVIIIDAGLAVELLGVVWAGLVQTHEGNLLFAAAAVGQVLVQLSYAVESRYHR